MLYPAISNTILVLDDDVDAIDLIRQALARDEFAVEFAVDWQSALELVRITPPALILIDYRFAGDHLEDFLMRAHRRRPALPIVLMGGASVEESGIHRLQKPILEEVLIEQVHALLGTSISKM